MPTAAQKVTDALASYTTPGDLGPVNHAQLAGFALAVQNAIIAGLSGDSPDEPVGDELPPVEEPQPEEPQPEEPEQPDSAA